jgi:hypothetical protein
MGSLREEWWVLQQRNERDWWVRKMEEEVDSTQSMCKVVDYRRGGRYLWALNPWLRSSYAFRRVDTMDEIEDILNRSQAKR